MKANMGDELIGYDAIGLSELIRKGDITATELLDIVIGRIEKINPKLNAVIYKVYDQARAAAIDLISGTKIPKISDSIFFLVPFLAKNLFVESFINMD
jgi:Asp-tRNA(Asn)/Glu-tRNA(Gln) amidotransferase A subunit family amidase